MGRGVDFAEGFAGSSHAAGFDEQRPDVGIRDPARDDARLTIAFDTGIDRFASEAGGRAAGSDAEIVSILVCHLHESVQTGCGFGRIVDALLFGVPGEDGLENRGQVARLRDVTGEKQDVLIATAPQVGEVKLEVGQIAGEAFEIPEEHAVGAFLIGGTAQVGDQPLEVFAASDRGTAAGSVSVSVAQDDIMVRAPFL